MKYFLILLLIAGLVKPAHTQDQKFSALATIGVTSPILDNGIGFHLGINPSFRLSERFSAEGQISYLYTRIQSSFINGDSGFVNAVNTLAGGRFYLNKEDKVTRFYLNLLAGMHYSKEEIDSIARDGNIYMGYSAGAFVDFNNILFGLSLDTPQNIVLKLGYSF